MAAIIVNKLLSVFFSLTGTGYGYRWNGNVAFFKFCPKFLQWGFDKTLYLHKDMAIGEKPT